MVLLRYIDAGNILVDPVSQDAEHLLVLHWFNLWCVMKQRINRGEPDLEFGISASQLDNMA